jgi:hypothetical protein
MSQTITINNINELIHLVESEFLTDYEKATEILQALIKQPIFYLGAESKAEFIAQLQKVNELFKKGYELPLFICESLEPAGG